MDSSFKLFEQLTVHFIQVRLFFLNGFLLSKINHFLKSVLSETFCCLPVRRLLVVYLISGFVHWAPVFYISVSFFFHGNACFTPCHILLSSSIICIAGSLGSEQIVLTDLRLACLGNKQAFRSHVVTWKGLDSSPLG